MALETTRVPVALGAGLDDSEDSLLLRAPFAAMADNVRPAKKRSYRKRPGFSSLYAGASTVAPLLAGGERECLLLGNSPARVINESNSKDTDLGAPYPLTISRVPVMAGKGFVHSVQAASSANYTCVVVSQVGDVTTEDAGSGEYLESDYECVAVILDATDTIVWGPYKLPAKLKWLPRVEPVDDGEFVIFAAGLEDGEGDLKSIFLTTTPKLYMSFADVGAGAPTVATNLGGFWPSQDSTGKHYKLYDTTTTYSAGNPGVAIVAYPRNVGPKRLDIYTSNDGTVLNSATQSITGTDNEHIAVHWHAASSTLLIYEGDDNNLWYMTSTLTSIGSITGPALVGIDSATTFEENTRPHQATPVFYESGNGSLFINERQIVVTGSNPGTPSLSTTHDERLPMLYEPFNLGTEDTIFSFGSMGTAQYDEITDANFYGHWRRGASSVELYHLEVHPAFPSDKKPVIDATLAESRLGDHNHSLFTFLTYNPPPDGPESELRESPCVTGQLAALGGGVQYPMAVLTSQQNPRGSALDAPKDYGGWGGSFSGFGADGEETAVMGDGAGWYNDEQIIVLTRVEAGSPIASRFPHESSTVIAAGQVMSWGRDIVTPIALRPPVIKQVVSHDGASEIVTASRQITPESVGVRLGAETGGGQQIDWDDYAYYKAVFVATDANGLEYRSPPSQKVLHRIAAGADDNPQFCPTIELDVFPSVLAFYGTARALDVEIYVTQRTDGTVNTEDDIDESTYTMINRMPLQKDTDGYFVVDTLQDFVRYDHDQTAGTDWQPPYVSPPHTNPLYTLNGEKPPQWLPAMHVMASAGEYLFGLAAEDEYEVWVSKPNEKGRIAEFNAALSLLLPPESGGGISLAGTYDRVYALCRRGVYELPALGGFDAAGQGSFPPWRLVYEGDPCVNHMGTVRTPAGVFYVTGDGPRLLAAGGDDSPVGERVAAQFADWSAVTDAVHVPASDEVIWFDASGGVALDLRQGAWTTHGFSALGAARLGSALARINSLGAVVKEDPASATDAGVAFIGEVRTSWIDFEDVLGFKRVRAVALLGRLENAPTTGSLRVYLRYNYVDSTIDTFEWTAAELAALSLGLQLRIKPSRQKCDAIQIGVVEVLENTGTVEEPVWESDIDWTLAGLQLRVAGKKGLMKLEQGAKK